MNNCVSPYFSVNDNCKDQDFLCWCLCLAVLHYNHQNESQSQCRARQGLGQQGGMFRHRSPEAATWFNILNRRRKGFLLFRACLKKMGPPQNEFFLATVILEIYIYMVLLYGILFVLTEKNKGSFLNVYEGG